MLDLVAEHGVKSWIEEIPIRYGWSKRRYADCVATRDARKRSRGLTKTMCVTGLF